MRVLKHLTTWLLLLTVFLASGVVSAKVASGVQNLSGGLHQAETTSNWLSHQAKIGFSYDDASGSPVAPKSGKGITKEFLPRKAPGRDGGLSAQIIERQNGEVISRTHRVIKDGKILHQHQNHVGKHGGVRQFPDQWTGTTTKNAPYENVPPKFKPDRVPGGRTF